LAGRRRAPLGACSGQPENEKADGLVVKVGPKGTFKLNPKRKNAANSKAKVAR
jgi:hypothetical protein